MTCKPSKTPETALAGEWDFAGQCAPAENGQGAVRFETFTLGCFQWTPMSRGGKMKPGKVQHRVKGTRDDVAGAYARARAFCAKKNAQQGVAS